ncbi:MAG: DUF4876 domain-containing protein [Bacteroidales bacterium]|nr:DUF4876 domain-containing protein [Bacteroidales bacterium]
MRRYHYIFIFIAFLVSCEPLKHSDPYAENLNALTVTVVYPEDFADIVHEGVPVLIEDMNSRAKYSGITDASGVVRLNLPDGLYRLNASDRKATDVFNGAADKVAVSGGPVNLRLPMAHSKTGAIIIKEIYCGGCKKLPQEGDYQSDQYFILHNNDYEVQYLDSLCFGTMAPYNSTGVNSFISRDKDTGEIIFPAFIPVIQAVWQFPGDGKSFPLHPGEDAVVCLRGAIDHTVQYPLSVNLNRPDYFVCYNATYFPNTEYHPAPGDKISVSRYLDVVIKTGKANAYTMSISSPAVIVFKASGTTIQDFVRVQDNITPVPGSEVDNVVKIPYEWVYDAVEVFDGRSANNAKRLAPSMDAGYVLQSDVFMGRSLMRHVDEQASASAGYEVLADTNNSLNDFYETDKQSLHE